MNIKNILIAILVLVICLKQCGKAAKSDVITVDGKPYIIIKEKIDTVIKTNTITKYKNGAEIYKDTTIYVAVPTKIDTSAILKDYFAKNIYRDTLDMKDAGNVILTDTITQNKIWSRSWIASIKQKTIYDTKYLVVPPKNEYYYGIGFGTDMISVGGMLKTKKNNVYQINLGVNSQLSPTVSGGLYWKL